MKFYFGTNAGSDNLGRLNALDVKEALKKAIKITKVQIEGRPRYYKRNWKYDAAITCVSKPSCERYVLGVRAMSEEALEL